MSTLPGYDDALFWQKLKQRALTGAVTQLQVEDAFWETCGDLSAALAEQAPERMEEARAAFRRDYLPNFVAQLSAHALRLSTPTLDHEVKTQDNLRIGDRVGVGGSTPYTGKVVAFARDECDVHPGERLVFVRKRVGLFYSDEAPKRHCASILQKLE